MMSKMMPHAISGIKTIAESLNKPNWHMPVLIVDKPSVCQRGLPGRLQIKDLRPATGTGMHFYRKCKHLHPQFAIVDLHRSQARLQLSLLTGLTSACFVPQFAIVALLRCRLQVSFAHWTSASPVSRTARGEAPSHRRRPPCAPQKIPEMTYTPSFLI